MFSFKRPFGTIDINYEGERISAFGIPTDRKYPETKEEGYEVLKKSYKIISDELSYMVGCIYLIKADKLRPHPKKTWYAMLFTIGNVLVTMQEALGIKHDDLKSDPNIPF